jgi:DNA (cytosine-5)-methyltransferase 1
MSGKVKVVLAVNHWRTAVYSHQANHLDTRHICAEIDMVNPRDFVDMGIDVLFASPECVFHSNARGGLPVDDQRRASAWCVPRWAEIIRPKWLVVENVREFEDWGPLGENKRTIASKRGEVFAAWVNALRALNYRVEWRLLNAADYGGATKRVRLFVIARLGNRSIPWPTPTHTQPQWEPASTIIDWSLPCPSVFHRKRPLADNTLRRIEAGLRKFCGFTGPFISTFHNGDDGERRNYPISEPLPVQDTQNRHALVTPFIADVNHGGSSSGRLKSVNEPLGCLTTKNGKALVFSFLTSYFANGKPQDLAEPLSTITTKPRHGLATVRLFKTMNELKIRDIGFRMLEPHELAAAQGFPAGYSIHGSKADQVKQIGNSVHTLVAKAISEQLV